MLVDFLCCLFARSSVYVIFKNVLLLQCLCLNAMLWMNIFYIIILKVFYYVSHRFYFVKNVCHEDERLRARS